MSLDQAASILTIVFAAVMVVGTFYLIYLVLFNASGSDKTNDEKKKKEKKDEGEEGEEDGKKDESCQNNQSNPKMLAMVLVGLICLFFVSGFAYSWTAHLVAWFQGEESEILWSTLMSYKLFWVLHIVVWVLTLVEWTMVDEGTSQYVMAGGAAVRPLMSWEGRYLNKRGRVVKGTDPNWLFRWWRWLFKGFRIVGIRWWHYVNQGEFRWDDMHLGEEEQRVVHHSKKLSYVLVKPDVYTIKITKAETKSENDSGGRIAIGLIVLVTVRCFWPWATLFRAPPQWWENMSLKIYGWIAGWVREKLYDEVLAMKGDSTFFTNDFKKDPLYKTAKGWGLWISEIQIKDIILPKEIEEAGESARRKRLESEAFGAATMGAQIAQIAELTGKSYKAIQGEFKVDMPKALAKYKDIMEANHDLIVRKVEMENGALVDVRGDGILAYLAKILAGKSTP